MTREEALRSKGRHGMTPQRTTYPRGSQWYGQVVDVHSGGDYVLFKRAIGHPRWIHREHVTLHDFRTCWQCPTEAACTAQQACAKHYPPGA